MEVEGSAGNYKSEMESKLKERGGRKLTASDLERIHEAVHQSKMEDFSESEPRNKIFKQVKSRLIHKLEEESHDFKNALHLAREKVLRQGNELVDSVVKSYEDTMKNGAPKSEPAYEQQHEIIKSVCLKTIENSLKLQNKDVVKMFVDKADDRIERIRKSA